MKRLVAALAIAIALPSAARAQSLFSTQGLGVPIEGYDARARALGVNGVGLAGLSNTMLNPADAAGTLRRGVSATFQPWSGTARLNGEQGDVAGDLPAVRGRAVGRELAAPAEAPAVDGQPAGPCLCHPGDEHQQQQPTGQRHPPGERTHHEQGSQAKLHQRQAGGDRADQVRRQQLVGGHRDPGLRRIDNLQRAGNQKNRREPQPHHSAETVEAWAGKPEHPGSVVDPLKPR